MSSNPMSPLAGCLGLLALALMAIFILALAVLVIGNALKVVIG